MKNQLTQFWIICSTLITLISPLAFAQPVVVRSSQSTKSDYESYMNVYDHKQKPVEYFKQQLFPSESQISDWLFQVKTAELNPEISLQEVLNLYQLIQAKPMNEESNELLTQVIRLLQSKDSQKEIWEFELQKNNQFKNKKSSSYKTVSTNLYQKFPFADEIRLNGHLLKNQSYDLIDGDYQLVVLSNSHEPYIQMGKLDQILHSDTALARPLSARNCLLPDFSKLPLDLSYQAEIFYSTKCVIGKSNAPSTETLMTKKPASQWKMSESWVLPATVVGVVILANYFKDKSISFKSSF